MRVKLNQNERIDDLQIHDLKIIQQIDGFCFGVDAVLLSNFVTVKKGFKGADFGTGTGIIPILVAGKSQVSHIYALEIQEEVAEMANRSIVLNDLSDKIEVLNINLKDAQSHIEPHSLDFITSNPPYMHGMGLTNENEKKRISRHEIHCTLDDIMKTASKLLKDNGSFFMIHRPTRLCDIFVSARNHKLEPKLVRFVHPKPSKAPNLVLIKFVRTAKPELKMLDPLYVHKEDGSYDEEIIRTYSIMELGEELG